MSRQQEFLKLMNRLNANLAKQRKLQDAEGLIRVKLQRILNRIAREAQK